MRKYYEAHTVYAVALFHNPGQPVLEHGEAYCKYLLSLFTRCKLLSYGIYEELNSCTCANIKAVAESNTSDALEFYLDNDPPSIKWKTLHFLSEKGALLFSILFHVRYD